MVASSGRTTLEGKIAMSDWLGPVPTSGSPRLNKEAPCLEEAEPYVKEAEPCSEEVVPAKQERGRGEYLRLW